MAAMENDFGESRASSLTFHAISVTKVGRRVKIARDRVDTSVMDTKDVTIKKKLERQRTRKARSAHILRAAAWKMVI